MFYTDFKKSSITENRQVAIDQSRHLAKQLFVATISKIEVSIGDPYGNESYNVVPNCTHEELVSAYESYLINRSTVYEVKFSKIDKAF